MARGNVEGVADALNRAGSAERVEAMLVKHERDLFSRNESIAGVFVVEGGAEGAHSRTGVGVGWAANMPNKCSSVKWSVAEGA